ncbi:hypothetical protein ALC62_02603 [Cyphomyrmex costatus]|uniref:Uncharacterized protein n=1 Tax=Cyphomyrmex costatus TaxID=456900 RepID=A0A195D2B8_9HYME|nr:hypothetical protein ALC62_02603 [Cyphomyrmex costatus]
MKFRERYANQTASIRRLGVAEENERKGERRDPLKIETRMERNATVGFRGEEKGATRRTSRRDVLYNIIDRVRKKKKFRWQDAVGLIRTAFRSSRAWDTNRRCHDASNAILQLRQEESTVSELPYSLRFLRLARVFPTDTLEARILSTRMPRTPERLFHPFYATFFLYRRNVPYVRVMCPESPRPTMRVRRATRKSLIGREIQENRTTCEDEALNATFSSGFLLPERKIRDFIVDIGPILTMAGIPLLTAIEDTAGTRTPGDAAYYAAALGKLMILLRERGRNGKTRVARTLLHGVQHEWFNQYSSRDFDYN